MPWLTVLTAFLTIVGAALACNKSGLLLSLYLVSIVTLFCVTSLQIYKLPKSVLVLSITPLLFMTYCQVLTPTISANNSFRHKAKEIYRGNKYSSQSKSADYIDSLRQTITNMHLHNLGTKGGGLLSSMVLGDHAVKVDDQLLKTFRTLGLSHILAASGFNLTIVTLLTYWLLRQLSLSRKIVICIVCVNVVFYANLAGLSASIVRAAITCVLVLIVHYYYRRLHSLAALSLVLIINSIIAPDIIRQTGAQLSYTAVAGIVFGANVLADNLTFGSRNKLIAKCAAAVAVILMAQLSVLPIQLYHFKQTSYLFLPANLIIDPLVTPITIMGFTASILGIMNFPSLPIGQFLCQIIDSLAAIPLQTIIYITQKLADCNLSTINTGQPYVIAIIFYYLTLIAFIKSLNNSRHRLITLVLFICGFMSLFYQSDHKHLPLHYHCQNAKNN